MTDHPPAPSPYRTDQAQPVTFQRARLRRIKDTIHGPVCLVTARYVSLPWHWAEDHPDAYVQERMAVNGLRACKVCKPFENEHERPADE